MPAFHLTIQTPDRALYDGSVDRVRLSTEDGELEVYPAHADLQGAVGFTRVAVVSGTHEEDFTVRHGMLFVDHAANTVHLAAFDGHKTNEMDTTTVAQYLTLVHARLDEGKPLSDLSVRFLQDQKVALEKQIEETV